MATLSYRERLNESGSGAVAALFEVVSSSQIAWTSGICAGKVVNVA